MSDAQYSGLSPQSVVAVVQRNYKYMHFPLNHYHASVTEGFCHASVGWQVNTSIRRHRLEAGHAVINHLDVSIYL